MTFKGKSAVVTGAAQGIGYAIAKRLASLGAQVALADINLNKLIGSVNEIKAENADVIHVEVDVSRVDSIRAMIDHVVKAFGKIDILVNNAGILRSTPIDMVTEEEWDLVMRVNMKSVFFASKYAIPYLKQRPNPRIINISSLAGRMGGFESGISYAASKGGVISLTYNMAKQLAPFGITVNAVCPGTICSDIIKQWTDEQIAELVEKIPLKRLGTLDNVASAVVYLASDDAAFITGHLMDVNGGAYFG